MSFTIRIDGIAEAKAELSKGCDELARDLQQAVAHTSQVTVRELRAAAPKGDAEKRKDGDQVLSESIEPGTVYRTKNGGHGSVEIAAEHASLVVDGTSAHPIDAKNVKNLRFYWKSMGVDFVGPHVNHPGTKPNDFVSGPVAAGQATIERDAQAAVAKLAAKLSSR